VFGGIEKIRISLRRLCAPARRPAPTDTYHAQAIYNTYAENALILAGVLTPARRWLDLAPGYWNGIAVRSEIGWHGPPSSEAKSGVRNGETPIRSMGSATVMPGLEGPQEPRDGRIAKLPAHGVLREGEPA